ncbi:Pre-mRNA-splicing factor [Coelomomyces lativittatus]|nr:Pre-mRNA-splicing factor [Coelomomyces lativittatus]
MGHKCEYMHRIPKLDDLEETMKDCFGRDRHRDERDDMNGVGCFNRENRTIYLGNLHPYDVSHGERVIRRHFSVFGEIERINVIHGKAIAFVRYKKRANAEFAKEAMEHQALDAGEMLNVRWANDDPNPRAQMEAKRKLEETFVHHYVAKKAKDAAVAATEATHLNLPSTSLTHSKSTMNSSSSSSSSSSLPLTQDPTLNHWIQQHPTFKQVYQYYQVQALPSPPPPPPPPPSMLPSSSSNPLHPLNASTSVHTPPTEATSLPSSSTLIPSVEPTPPSVALIAGYESEDEDEDGKEEKEVENEK